MHWLRYRSGNSWITAAYVQDETVTVETVGNGVQNVGPGFVLIQSGKPDTYDVQPVEVFEQLGYNRVPTVKDSSESDD